MKKLTQKEVRSWLVSLAQSQGFYGRLLRDWDEAAPAGRRNVMRELHSLQVKDIYDFVIYIEG
jgi:hypothetical protein